MRRLEDGARFKAALIFQLRLFFIALQFFTRLPIPRWVGFQDEWLQQSARYYPLAGLVVGGIVSAVYVAVAGVLPHAVAVLLSIGAGVFLTGAFHEDGLADVCDGFGGGYTREHTLEIMKDSRVGTYGAVGLMLVMALKAAALIQMAPAALVAALCVGHTLSRLMSAALIWRLDYARESGLAKPLARHMSSREFCISACTAAAPVAVAGIAGILPWLSLAAGVAVAGLGAIWLSRLFIRGIGGFTGDCLGAAQQISELGFYLGALAVLSGAAS